MSEENSQSVQNQAALASVQMGEAVAEIVGAKLVWLQGGMLQLPPGTKLYTAPPAAEALQEEVDLVRGQRNASNREIESLRDQLTAAEQEVDRLTRQVQEYKGYYEGCESQLVAAVEERLQLRAQLRQQLAQPAGNVGDDLFKIIRGIGYTSRRETAEIVEAIIKRHAILSTPAVKAGGCPEEQQRVAQKVESEHQAFDEWARENQPHGDVTQVHRQWIESAEYANWLNEWEAQHAVVKAEQLAAGQVPEGMMLIPIEPNNEWLWQMHLAYWREDSDHDRHAPMPQSWIDGGHGARIDRGGRIIDGVSYGLWGRAWKAMTALALSAAPVPSSEGQDTTPVRNDLLRFLHGEASFHGCHFGEKLPGERGYFWWRKYLPTAPTNPDAEAKE